MTDTFDGVLPDGPVEYGQAEQVDGAEAFEDLPFLDVDQYRDYRIPVKIDGEEITIPLAEAVAGYQRQADYTRKTQELASQRQQLQEAAAIRAALEQDPKGTIDLLARHYGITPQQAADEFGMDPFGDDLIDDPVSSRMAELDKRIRAFEEQQAQAQLQTTIQSLQNKYGEDFDPREVVSAALQMGSTDLEGVFKQIAFDRLVQKQRASARQADPQRAAKQAAAVVSGGSSAGAGGDEVGPIRSVADAYFAAKRMMGA